MQSIKTARLSPPQVHGQLHLACHALNNAGCSNLFSLLIQDGQIDARAFLEGSTSRYTRTRFPSGEDSARSSRCAPAQAEEVFRMGQ